MMLADSLCLLIRVNSKTMPIYRKASHWVSTVWRHGILITVTELCVITSIWDRRMGYT